MKWQGYDVDAFEFPEEVAGAAFLNYNVQIPLKREAIQLTIFGPAARKAELKRLLNETLAGLQGESNWLRSAVGETTRLTTGSCSWAAQFCSWQPGL